MGGSQPFTVIFLPHTVLWSNCFFRHLCFRDISFFLLTTQIALGRVSCHDSLLLRLLLPPLPDNKRNGGPKETGGEKTPNYSPDCFSLSKVEGNVNYHSWIQNQIELLISWNPRWSGHHTVKQHAASLFQWHPAAGEETPRQCNKPAKIQEMACSFPPLTFPGRFPYFSFKVSVAPFPWILNKSVLGRNMSKWPLEQQTIEKLQHGQTAVGTACIKTTSSLIRLFSGENWSLPVLLLSFRHRNL